MFNLAWDPTSLALAGLIALSFDAYLAHILHCRYDQQFGWSFVLSGLVTFSLPSLIVVGLPLYLVLASPAALLPRSLALAALMFLYVRWTLRLRKRILSKIFPRPTADSASHVSEKTPA